MRTPVGQAGGALRERHPATLLSCVLDEMTLRYGLEPDRLHGVLGVCSVAVGAQAMNVTRSAALGAGWPERIAALTMEGGSAAAMQALELASARLRTGAPGPIVVAGVESASWVPVGSATGTAVGKPFGPAVHARYEAHGGLRAPAAIVEALAETHRISRADMDSWVLQSRARYSERKPDDDGSVVAVDARWNRPGESAVLADETAAELDPAQCRPMFEDSGAVTAANLALPGDGAAAVVLGTPEMARDLNLEPLARVGAVAVGGSSPIEGSSGSEVANAALRAAGISLDDCERIEVHEDAATTPLSLARELAVDLERINRKGGALAAADAGAASVLGTLGLVGYAQSEASHALCVAAGSAGTAGAAVVHRP